MVRVKIKGFCESRGQFYELRTRALLSINPFVLCFDSNRSTKFKYAVHRALKRKLLQLCEKYLFPINLAIILNYMYKHKNKTMIEGWATEL